jgi:hypothetical protein
MCRTSPNFRVGHRLTHRHRVHEVLSETGLNTNRRFGFYKCSQLFVRRHNEMLSVVATCIEDPNRLSVAVGHGQSDIAFERRRDCSQLF